MGLVLCNGHTSTIWTTIMFYSPETCGGDGGDFEMMGWWRIEPGACANVYSNDLADLNRYWFYYAIAADDYWAGPWQALVPRTAFGGLQSCWTAQSGGGDDVGVGYRILDVGDAD